MAFSISIGTAVASTALSSLSAYRQAQAAQDQSTFQAQVARNNAIIAERRAVDATERGEKAASKHKQKVAHLAARQTVTLAGQGVDVTTGTSVDLLADTAELGAIDEQIIRHNSAREAYEFRVGAANARTQSTLFSSQADAYNPALAGTTSLLAGASNVASTWYNQNKRVT